MSKRTVYQTFFAALIGVFFTNIAFTQEAMTEASEIVSDSPAPAPASVPAMADSQLEPYVDGIVDALMWDHDVPGLVVAITGSDAPELVKGYGFSDAALTRRIDADSALFRIGSISKTFTWTAVMMLVDRGELELDRDVNDYLTVFKVEDTFPEPVTLRDLMAHRAGFETSLRVFQAENTDSRSLGEALADTQPIRVNPPGTRTSYSNWGAALAAHIVEEASGKLYAEFLQEEILTPLGMSSTTIKAPGLLEGEWLSNMTTGLERKEGEFNAAETMQIGPFAPAGAMAATASDMARWMRFHLNLGELDGVRLMSRQAHEQMRTRGYPDRPGAADVAHGFQTFEIHGVSVYGHGGSTGVFLSQMLLVPELDLGLYVSKNAGNEGYATNSILTRLIIDRSMKVEAPMIARAAEGNNKASLEEFAGDYRNNRRSFTTFLAVTSIGASVKVSVHENGVLLVTSNDTTKRYAAVPGSADLFENEKGERIQFQRDDAGVVVVLNDNSGVHSHERVEPLNSALALLLPGALLLFFTITTLLGFWRRWRQQPETTDRGRLARRIAWFGVIGMLIYLLLGVFALVSLSALSSAADIRLFPPTSLKVFTAAGWFLSVLSLLLLVGLIPAWKGSGWGLLRKANYSFFALSMAGFCLVAYCWNMFGAPLI